MRSFPAEDALALFLAGAQDGRSAGAPRPELAGNLATGDALGGRNHFQNGKAAAIAHVEGLAGNAGDIFEIANVGVTDVHNVDVIANASPIGRRDVRSEAVDIGSHAGASVHHRRHESTSKAILLAT